MIKGFQLFYGTLFISILLFAGCASAKKPALKAPPNIKSELSKIEIDINAGAYKKALSRLQKIAQIHADTDAAHDAHIMMGQIYFKQNDFQNSYKSYLAVINSEFFSPREVDASIGAAKALQKLGRYDEALSLTQRALKAKPLSQATMIEIHSLRHSILQQTGDRLDSLKALIYLAENVTDKDLRERYRLRALDHVESQLRENELETVARDSDYGFVRPYALLRVARSYFEQKDYSRAESYYSKVVSLAPGSDYANEAAQAIQQIEARRRVDPYTVGAVLPLSGRQSAVAYKTLRGLQLGLGITGRNQTNLKLAVIDSEGNPDAARRAVERLVVEDSVVAIVGDIVSRTAEPVAQKADELGVVNINLSQKAGLTETGDYVFRNALTSEAQVRELVAAAMDQYGMKRFAIMFPNDAYGVEYANIFWDEVLSRGGQITAVQAYAPNEKDFASVIRRLVGTYYLEDRQDEYNFLLKEWYSKQKRLTARTEPPDDLLPPIIDFDAIFIPDGVKALGQIASMLVYQNVGQTRLLGTNLWNTKELLDRGTKLSENALFVDAKVAVDPSFKESAFYKEFKQVYGEDPTIFEAQAYDTGLILRRYLTSGVSSRAALKESLKGLREFNGAIGSITVNSAREFSRPLTVLSNIDGQIAPIKPAAPTTRQ